MATRKGLSSEEQADLLDVLKRRFERNLDRHKSIGWGEVQKQLEGAPEKLAVIGQMEATGGEPDVIGKVKGSGEIVFCDCSAETPSGRRSLCYDDEALEARKEHKPKGSAVGLAAEMGIELLTEAEYHDLQKLGEFDTKTSSWLATPSEVRDLGGSIFGDRRYDRVFIYHNGAQSYYASRGFRGTLKV